MSLSKDDILNAIAEMSVMDVVALVEAMEEKFGVSAAAAVAAAPAAPAQEEVEEMGEKSKGELTMMAEEAVQKRIQAEACSTIFVNNIF